MICPFCGNNDTKVIDSRDTNDGKAIRRRRECEKCQARFSTYEEMEIMRLTVVKRDGSKQEYDKGKIETGIRKALEKRPVSEDKISKLLGDIEFEIQSREPSKNEANAPNEISSKEIGKIALEKLKEIDDVAYLRFASVYKSFKNADSFRKEMDKMET
ncbi:MAG TPA: transcriptional regulator NrdR [Candidatus Moranbacteria bacterium]|jgi:transcriptional repressor NrdR|nr:transcriptional repressor NrdR [Candidatus Moranbacteria bacterium]HOF42883.1 transcriptional regulator NrdR [Candidatus Moranbacteria bacterium]HPX94341.1 transcriptional regulator NrdR [Candidatus Moranbacteria bacterium]HQB59470.1 transcriptional regulator NrdR [Candidatus Moranbacteria bacterium]